MPLPFISKKRVGGWLVVLAEFQNSFHVKVMAPNGKLYPFQFSTQAEATEFFNFFCSKLSAFLSSLKTTIKSRELSLFDNSKTNEVSYAHARTKRTVPQREKRENNAYS